MIPARGVIVITEKDMKPKTHIEHLFFDGLIQNSFPFNWLIFYKLKDKYKERESFNATLLLGYLVSWQTTYTKKKKLKPGGYSYRSREYIQYDIGLGKDAQKVARNILDTEGLIKVKPMPGQSSYYKIQENNVFKYLEGAKKYYHTRNKSDMLPNGKTATSNDLEFNDLNEHECKGLEPNNQVKAITFNDYKNLYKPKDIDDPCEVEYYNNAIAAIECFIYKHLTKFPPSEHPGTWAKKLKPGTWESVINTLFSLDDKNIHSDDIDFSELLEYMDIYFDKGSYDNCDYSIVHFNHPEIKKILSYEWQRS